jgi:hypothetical protein
MAATIRTLRTRKDRQRTSTTARLVQVIEEYAQLCLELGHEVPEGIREHRAELGQEAAAEAEETFVMLSIRQFDAVHEWLAHNSANPMMAVRLWTKLIGLLDSQTGEIMATRAKLAEMVNTHPDEVSRIMGELSKTGAIIRRRVPANGPVRYFMNPKVGTHLPKDARRLAQRDAPELKLIASPPVSASKVREPA